MEGGAIVKRIISIVVGAVSAGCNALVAEPIRVDQGSYSIAAIDPSGADATYGCDLVQGDRDALYESGATLVLDTGDVAWGGRCKQPGGDPASICSNDGVWPLDCVAGGPGCSGLSGLYDAAADITVWHGGDYVSCAHHCQSDDDCPAASSGTAHASCIKPSIFFYPETGWGTCRLGCEQGETCPDGFFCMPSSRHEQFESPSRGPRQCFQYVAIEYQEPGLPGD